MDFNSTEGKPSVKMWCQKRRQQIWVQDLLAETIKTLCKNTLAVSGDIAIEGLLGITINNSEVLLVNIKESIRSKRQIPDSSDDAEHLFSGDLNPKPCKVPKRQLFSESGHISSTEQCLDSSHDITGKIHAQNHHDTPNPNPNPNPTSPRQNQAPDCNEQGIQGNKLEPVSLRNPSKEESQELRNSIGEDCESERMIIVKPVEEAVSQGSLSTLQISESTLPEDCPSTLQINEAYSNKKSERYQSELTMVHYPTLSQATPIFEEVNEKDSSAVEESADNNDDCLFDDDDDENDSEEVEDSDATPDASDSTLTSDPWHYTCNDPTQQGYTCSYCAKHFKYKANLKKHCVLIHNIPHLYKCPYCDKFAVNRNLFKEHVLTHQDMMAVKCGICSRMFPSHNHLKRHLVTPNVHRNSLPRLTQQ